MRKPTRKLLVRSETLRTLAAADLSNVAGGADVLVTSVKGGGETCAGLVAPPQVVDSKAIK